MPKYRVCREAREVIARAWYVVEADSPQEAADKVNRDEGEFDDEELSINSFCESDATDAEEVDDDED